MILRSLELDPATLARETGWAVEARGLCKDGVCVPFARSGATIAAREIADALAMPLVGEADLGVWALGPRSGGRALASAAAPDLVLPDLAGQVFRLSSLRGQKVLLVAWAPW